MSWLIGMGLNVTGSLMVNGGTNVMKSGHNLKAQALLEELEAVEAAEEEAEKNGGVLKEPEKLEFEEPRNSWGLKATSVWRIGVISFTVGSIVNFLSFAFAAQSLLAALGGVQFVSNVVFSYTILGETPSTRVICATVIIVIGLCLAVANANHDETSYTEAELLALYDDLYVTFLAGVILTLILSEVTYRYYTKKEDQGMPLPGNEFVRPVTYALVSATIGTQSVLQSKCIAELVKTTAKGGGNAFFGWLVWVLLVVFLAGVWFWLTRLNNGLKLFDGLVIIPLCQAFWTISAIVQGGMYFKEFQSFSLTQAIGFAAGVGAMLVGVYYLTPGAQSPLTICFKDGQVPRKYDPRTWMANILKCCGYKDEDVALKYPLLVIPEEPPRRRKSTYGAEMAALAANPMNKDASTEESADEVSKEQSLHKQPSKKMEAMENGVLPVNRGVRSSSMERPSERRMSRAGSVSKLTPDQRRRMSSARAYTSDYLEAFFGPPSSIDAYGADVDLEDEVEEFEGEADGEQNGSPTNLASTAATGDASVKANALGSSDDNDSDDPNSSKVQRRRKSLIRLQAITEEAAANQNQGPGGLLFRRTSLDPIIEFKQELEEFRAEFLAQRGSSSRRLSSNRASSNRGSFRGFKQVPGKDVENVEDGRRERCSSQDSSSDLFAGKSKPNNVRKKSFFGSLSNMRGSFRVGVAPSRAASAYNSPIGSVNASQEPSLNTPTKGNIQASIRDASAILERDAAGSKNSGRMSGRFNPTPSGLLTPPRRVSVKNQNSGGSTGLISPSAMRSLVASSSGEMKVAEQDGHGNRFSGFSVGDRDSGIQSIDITSKPVGVGESPSSIRLENRGSIVEVRLDDPMRPGSRESNSSGAPKRVFCFGTEGGAETVGRAEGGDQGPEVSENSVSPAGGQRGSDVGSAVDDGAVDGTPVSNSIEIDTHGVKDPNSALR